MKKYIFFLVFIVVIATVSCSAALPEKFQEQNSSGSEAATVNRILLVVAWDQAYYSEYKVLYEALRAQNYSVDVASAAVGNAVAYTVTGDIVATANSLTGSSYADFTSQFQSLFGKTWETAWNATVDIPVNLRIQDIQNMNNYAALVMAGGTGMLDYRVDGSYAAQASGDRQISAANVQAVAEKLNSLAIEAIRAGKPVLAQCHASSIPVFFRIPGTSGPGAESLGYSLLKGRSGPGYPETATAATYTALDVTYNANDVVRAMSPHSSLTNTVNARNMIITSRDWYPQTVAHAARTVLNILQTNPSASRRTSSTSVLIIHGGEVNIGNCGAGNRTTNDVPCNYGTDLANLPTDYTHVTSLLNADSANDEFVFNVTGVNLMSGALPFTSTNQQSVLTYLNQFDVVIFYKHWDTNMTTQIQNALVSYVDSGGGVLALHHGLYNEGGKSILVSSLFGAQSSGTGWSATRETYNIYNTDYGHFITTYGLNGTSTSPPSWTSPALPAAANRSMAQYHAISVYDEIYNNMAYEAGITFGRAVGNITPLLSNNATSASQRHTTAFARRLDINADGTSGKVVFFQIGENRMVTNISHQFGQMLRNSLIWLKK
ncbi:MAG: ThuA domain-containing protein [Leptospiraceae bacterium]|nr:ThuA domain-containing protein [Leptospiraceae bacterium]